MLFVRPGIALLWKEIAEPAVEWNDHGGSCVLLGIEVSRVIEFERRGSPARDWSSLREVRTPIVTES